MLKAIEAVIEPSGSVHLLEKPNLKTSKRAIVTILEDNSVDEATLLSEASLAQDWLSAEEENAWKHLQKAQ